MKSIEFFDSKFDKYIVSSTVEENYVSIRYKFDNEYGASVIRHSDSYGGDKGLFELAVLDNDGYITYNTVITDDVLGWLTIDEVNSTLENIQSL